VERLLLDTDIGSDVDDAHALLFAIKSPDLSLEGVTTVYGKTDIRAKVARKILDYASRDDIPVHAGESMPRSLGPHGIWHTGREGEGVLMDDDYSRPLADMGIGERAAEFLVERIMSRPGEYNLVTIGALTNVAKAFELEPKVAGKIKRMYIMGGGITNSEHFSLDDIIIGALLQDAGPEHNIVCDTESAQKVFSTKVPKTVLSIDVTGKVPIARHDFCVLASGHPADEAVLAMTRVWFEYRDEQFRRLVGITCMHDPLTVAAINHPYLLKSVDVPLVVDDHGRTRIKKGGLPVKLCYDVDAKAFEKVFLDTIARPLPYAERLSNQW